MLGGLANGSSKHIQPLGDNVQRLHKGDFFQSRSPYVLCIKKVLFQSESLYIIIKNPYISIYISHNQFFNDTASLSCSI